MSTSASQQALMAAEREINELKKKLQDKKRELDRVAPEVQREVKKEEDLKREIEEITTKMSQHEMDMNRMAKEIKDELNHEKKH